MKGFYNSRTEIRLIEAYFMITPYVAMSLYDIHGIIIMLIPLCRMLSKAKRYVEYGATASPLNQRKHMHALISAKPSPFRLLLFDISQQLVEEDLENFKAFVEDYGEDEGFLTVKQLEEATTMYTLLMKSAKVGFIRPDDLSNLVTFLESSGHHRLVQKIEDFKMEQSKCILEVQ